METLTTITTHIAQVGIEVLEIAAMGILLIGSGKSIWMLIRHKPHVTLALTRFWCWSAPLWSWPSWRAWWSSTAPFPTSSPGR